MENKYSIIEDMFCAAWTTIEEDLTKEDAILKCKDLNEKSLDMYISYHVTDASGKRIN